MMVIGTAGVSWEVYGGRNGKAGACVGENLQTLTRATILNMLLHHTSWAKGSSVMNILHSEMLSEYTHLPSLAITYIYSNEWYKFLIFTYKALTNPSILWIIAIQNRIPPIFIYDLHPSPNAHPNRIYTKFSFHCNLFLLRSSGPIPSSSSLSAVSAGFSKLCTLLAILLLLVWGAESNWCLGWNFDPPKGFWLDADAKGLGLEANGLGFVQWLSVLIVEVAVSLLVKGGVV